MPMTVQELMSVDVITIPESATCREAVGLMFRHRVRHLPVVAADGALRGIVTDRDLRHHLFEPAVFKEVGSVSVEQLLTAVAVRQVMSSPVICVKPGDSLEEAARLMVEDKVGSLPVVRERRVVGILTETDLLRRIVRADQDGADVQQIVVSYP
jgi:acetoin utilization protein AcuB